MSKYRKPSVGASLLAIAISQTHTAKSQPGIQKSTDLAFDDLIIGEAKECLIYLPHIACALAVTVS